MKLNTQNFKPTTDLGNNDNRMLCDGWNSVNEKLPEHENGTTGITFVKPNNTLSITQKKFKIEFSKVESLEQVIDILKAMDLSIHWYNDNCPEQFKDLYEKGLLIEVK